MLFRPQPNMKKAELAARQMARRRVIYRSLVALMYVCLALDVVAGVVQARRFLLRSEYFALKGVDLEGGKKVTAWDVQVLGQIQEGQNILSLDLKQIARDVRRHPWIDELKIRRVLPDKLKVEVKERVPVAVLTQGCLYYVDAKGVVFKKVKAGEPVDFPVLTGLDQPGPIQKGKIGRKAILEGLALLDLVKNLIGFSSDQISEVHIDADLGWSVFAAPSGAQIHLGWEPYDRKLERFKKLIGQERVNLAQIRRIDLDFNKWAVVTPL